MKKNTSLALLLTMIWPLHVPAMPIVEKNFSSLPDVNIEDNIDLFFDFQLGALRWVNHSAPKNKLTNTVLSTDSNNNEFLNNSAPNPSDLLKVVISSLQTNNAENQPDFSSPIDIIISHLKTSPNLSKKTVALSQPASFWLVLAGLLGIIARKSRGNKS